MGTTERVIQFIEFKGISKYKFCKKLNFSNKFLDNSKNMGTDKACKILHFFPELNPEWLLTGTGEMLKEKRDINQSTEKGHNIVGNSNKIRSPNEVTECLTLLKKKDTQIDKIIDILKQKEEQITELINKLK